MILLEGETMTFDTEAATRAAAVAERLQQAGALAFFHDLVASMWTTNVARYDDALGDTARSLGMQCSENLGKRLYRSRRDDVLLDAGLTVGRRSGVVFCSFGEVTIRLVKAPSTSGLHPDWSTDLEWESNVRRESASRNDDVYRAPHQEHGHEALFPASGLGASGSLNEFFLVWNGLLSETPLTAGWLAIPTLRSDHVAAAEPLWRDEAAGDSVDARPDIPLGPNIGEEPKLHIRLKKNIREGNNGR